MPPVGRPSHELPSASSMMPSQNVGTAHMISENVSAETSIFGFAFPAGDRPSETPNKIEKNCPSVTSSSVLPNFARSTSPTGRRSDHDTPRLPCTYCPNVLKILIGEERLVQPELLAQRLLHFFGDAHVAPDHRAHRITGQNAKQEEVDREDDQQGDQREDDFAERCNRGGSWVKDE